MRSTIIAFTMLMLFASPRTAWAVRLWSDGDALTYTKGAVTMPYRLYLPKDYSPSKSYPLMLFLHGRGERGTDNVAQVSTHISGLIARTYEDYPAILVAPQLSAVNDWTPGASGDLTSDILARVQSQYSVNSRRIYATGLSMGGNGTTDYAAAFPSYFAAIAPMSGASNIPSNSYKGTLGDLPTWLFHGSADSTNSVTMSRNYYLDATGLSTISYGYTYYGYKTAISDPIRYTELTGLNHDIWNLLYANSSTALYDWMFAQSQPVPEPSSIGLVVSGLFVAGWFGLRRLAKQGKAD